MEIAKKKLEIAKKSWRIQKAGDCKKKREIAKKKLEIKGNKIIGYRIHVNDKYLTHFSKIENNKVIELKNFIINRSLDEKSS